MACAGGSAVGGRVVFIAVCKLATCVASFAFSAASAATVAWVDTSTVGVPSMPTSSLAQAALRLLQNHTLADEIAARAKTRVEEYSIKNVAERHVRLYSELLEKR